MAEVPTRLLVYNKENVCHLIRVVEAMHASGRATYQEVARKSGMAANPSVFSKVKKDPESKWQKINQNDYPKLIKYIYENDLYVPSDALAVIQNYKEFFYYSLLPFFSIDLTVQEVLAKRVCGLYNIYHHSFSENGNYVKGYAHIFKCPDSDALQVNQVFRSQPHCPSDPPAPAQFNVRPRTETFEGYVANIPDTSTVFILGRAEATNGPYFALLSPVIESKEGDKIFSLMCGRVLIMQAHRPATSRIYYERVDYEEKDIDQVIANLESHINIYPTELIPAPVRSFLKEGPDAKVDMS